MEYYNLNGGPTGRFPNTFDEVLESLNGRCLINLDKSWDYPDEQKKWSAIFEAVERHQMGDQIIFKSEAEPKYAKMFASMDKKYMYMPMLNKPSDAEPFIDTNINLVMVEVKFRTEDEPFAKPEVIRGLQERGVLIWGNALNLSTNWCLAAGHDDYVSLMGDPDRGWGYFIDHGYDIVQTDHLPCLVSYYRSRGLNI